MTKVQSVGRFVRRVGREAAWAPVAVLLLHAAGGHLFGHEPYVDPIMHFLGGAATAFFLRRSCSIGRDGLGAPSPLAVDLLAFGLTCTVALFWEFGEFLSDRYIGTLTHTTVASTLRDLLLGVLGALAYLVSSRLVVRRLAQ